MENAPKLYTTTLAAETRQCEAMTIPLTLDQLKFTMTRFWRTEYGVSDNESESDTDDEVEVSATVVEKDECKIFNCGKTGHIAKECRSGYGGGGREYSDRGFNGKCNNCDKQDHKKYNC